MRRLRSVMRLAALMTAVALVAAACGQSSSGSTEDSTTSTSGTDTTMSTETTETSDAGGEGGETDDENTELHVFHFKVNLQDQWQTLTNSYSESNPNVTFVNEIIGGGTAWLPILKSKFAAGQGPDIFIVEGPAQAAEFEDFLSDLSDEPWTERAFPEALEGLTIDGSVMGMPVNLEGYGYIYNKAIFDEAGVTEVPTTLDGLREAAGLIADAGYTPFGTGYGIWWVNGLHLMNMPFARQDDPRAFMESALAREASFSEESLFTTGLKELADITIEYGEDDPLTSDRDQQALAFVNEEVAMIQQGNWREIEILEANPDMEIGLVPMPLGNDPEEGDKLAVGVPFYFVVNSASSEAQQQEAREFLNWLVSSDEGKATLVDEFGFIPAYPDIEPSGLGGISSDILEYSTEGKVVPWMFGQFPDGSPQEMSDAFQKYIAGVQDWDQTIAEINATWDRLAG